jgi:hypothetical protein
MPIQACVSCASDTGAVAEDDEAVEVMWLAHSKDDDEDKAGPKKKKRKKKQPNNANNQQRKYENKDKGMKEAVDEVEEGIDWSDDE